VPILQLAMPTTLLAARSGKAGSYSIAPEPSVLFLLAMASLSVVIILQTLRGRS